MPVTPNIAAEDFPRTGSSLRALHRNFIFNLSAIDTFIVDRPAVTADQTAKTELSDLTAIALKPAL